MIEKPYISEYGAISDINAKISELFDDADMILIYTDKFVCSKQCEITDLEHLLEARIFDKNKEMKILRPTMDCGFSYRIIDDSKNTDVDYIEEKHYLDINTKISSGCDYVTTGGGKYTLPIENAEKVQIRNYISYDNQGIAQITDFRVVRYIGEEEK